LRTNKQAVWRKGDVVRLASKQACWSRKRRALSTHIAALPMQPRLLWFLYVSAQDVAKIICEREKVCFDMRKKKKKRKKKNQRADGTAHPG